VISIGARCGYSCAWAAGVASKRAMSHLIS
jgi:hypothetical protein